MSTHAESLDCAEISFASGDSVQDDAAPAAALCMNEAEFRAFYEKTAPPLRGYLRRVSGDASLADDLLQESYMRFLRAPLAAAGEDHRRHYLFRIATNLLRDHFRASKRVASPLPEDSRASVASRDFVLERDVEKLLLEMKPRERELLWLAYVEGYRHDEIAGFLRCRAASIRPMLFRARGKLAELLRARNWTRNSHGETKP